MIGVNLEYARGGSWPELRVVNRREPCVLLLDVPFVEDEAQVGFDRLASATSRDQPRTPLVAAGVRGPTLQHVVEPCAPHGAALLIFEELWADREHRLLSSPPSMN